MFIFAPIKPHRHATIIKDATRHMNCLMRYILDINTAMNTNQYSIFTRFFMPYL